MFGVQEKVLHERPQSMFVTFQLKMCRLNLLSFEFIAYVLLLIQLIFMVSIHCVNCFI